MRYNHLILGMGLGLAIGVGAGTAAADIPPPGLCDTEQAGEACDDPVDDAGQSVDGPGVCVQEECRRATPDGSMTYDCLMCRPDGEKPDPNTGGAAGAAGEPSAGKGGPSGQAGSSSAGRAGSPTKRDDSGGCSMGGAGSGGTLLTAAAVVLLGGALRRRRTPRA